MKMVLNGVDPPRICQECPCFHQIVIQKKVGQYCMAAKQVLREPKRIFEINLAVDNWTNTEIPEWCPIERVRDDSVDLLPYCMAAKNILNDKGVS